VQVTLQRQSSDANSCLRYFSYRGGHMRFGGRHAALDEMCCLSRAIEEKHVAMAEITSV
jgi:hypothetical protein